VNQAQRAIFDAVLTVAVFESGSEKPTMHQIALDKAKCEAAFLVSSRPVRIELDPDVNLLFEGKLEN